MIVYIDESYPDNQEKVILGALLVGKNEHSRFTSKIRDIKKKSKYFDEIKYSQINSKATLIVAKKMIKAYSESQNSFYRACIIPYSATKLEFVPGLDTNQKRVFVYTNSAKHLILANLPANTMSEIYFDEEERIKKTKLFSRLLKTRSIKGGKIVAVYSINSSDESRCLLQVCDLLTGAIKQDLYPTNTTKSRYKREFSKFVLDTFTVKGCDEQYWVKSLKKDNHKFFDKFFISYFKLPWKNNFENKRTAVSTVNGDSI